MGFKLTQNQYEQIVFLTKCIYVDDLVYPSFLGYQHSVVLLSGLRMNLFIGQDFDLFVICGTNSFRDWITNTKVALNITPRQHQQALKKVLQHYSTMDKDKPLIIAGHSLAGGIAEYCKSFMSNDVYCIGFNGCGVKHLCQNRSDDNILHIITSRDILNCITQVLPGKNYMKHMGNVKKIDDSKTFNPIKSHCNFEAFMKYHIDE